MTFSKEIIKTYGHAIKGISYQNLERASIKERSRLVSGGTYKDVKISLLDMTSQSATGTFKDWVACVTIAYCLEHDIKSFVTQSSGNTGNAIAFYAERFNIDVTIFHPKQSAYKINPVFKSFNNVHFIEVDEPELRLKQITKEYSEQHNVPWLPDFDLQMEGNKLRAYFLQDYFEHTGTHFDWHVQSISSGYGAFGFYQGVEEINSEMPLPRFLGVQQEAVSPYYHHIHGIPKTYDKKASVIEPTLFRSKPNPTLLKNMSDICTKSNGLFVQIDKETYNSYLEQALHILNYAHISISTLYTRIVEKASIIALIGLLKSVDDSLIAKGQHVLVNVTGGTSKISTVRSINNQKKAKMSLSSF